MIKTNTIKEGCPICNNDVVGNPKDKYFCESCNLLYESEHIRKKILS